MEQLEVERKFDIGEDAPLPALEGVVRVGESREHRMRAVYVDTVDLRLVRHRVTLRRREGGSDAGWHLKLPRGSARLEVHAPLVEGPGRMRVPEGHVRAAAEAVGLPEGPAGALVPVAVLRTARTEVDLLDGSGRVVAQLCDDRVTALPEGRRWREVEVELVGGGDEALLDRIGAELRRQGLVPAASPSKLSRALGDRPGRVGSGGGVRADDPAGEVVRSFLVEQVAAVLGMEAAVRADEPDAVHQARVAVRRLRSALRTFRRLMVREATGPLRGELRWWGAVLGAARDAEVLRDRTAAELEGLPRDLVRGPVETRVSEAMAGRQAAAHATLVEQLEGDRYLALVDALLELVAEPPWRGRAGRPASEVLPVLVEKAVDRLVEGRVRAVGLEGEARLRDLHGTRKRAKAVRHGWEALAPALGGPAAEQAEAWQRVTGHLGEMQDAVVSLHRLRELLAAAEAAGEPTLTYGVLLGRALEAAERSAAAGEHALDDALCPPPQPDARS